MKNVVYEKIKDEELLRLYKTDKDERAFDELMNRYKSMVRHQARQFFLNGGDTDDLIQEGMIGLYKSVRDFDEDREVLFSSFAYMCVRRQILTAISKDNAAKNYPLNTSLSILNQTDSESGTVNSEDIGVLSDGGVNDPESMLIEREEKSELLERLRSELSFFEKDVFDCYMDGMDLRAIAVKLNKDMKAIDNATQRIRIKAKSLK